MPRRLLLAAAVLAASALASVPGARAQTAEADWNAAYRLVLARDWTTADTALATFLERHPSDAHASAARFWTCFAHEQRERFPVAYDCYRAQAQATPTDRWAIEARTRLVAVAARLPTLEERALTASEAEALTTPYGVARPSSAPRASSAVVASGASQAGSFVVYGPDATRDTVWLAREPMRTRTVIRSVPGEALEVQGVGASSGAAVWAPTFGTTYDRRADTLPRDERVAVLAVEALGRRGSNDAVPDLSALAETGATPAIRGAALSALGRVGTPEAARALLAAARRVGSLSPDAYQGLVGALARAAATRPDTPGVVEEIERIARIPGLRVGAVSALSGIGTAEAERALVRLADAAAVAMDVRRAAVEGLGRSGTAQTVPLLARYARSPDVAIARAAVEGLSRIDAPEARTALLDLARMRR